MFTDFASAFWRVCVCVCLRFFFFFVWFLVGLWISVVLGVSEGFRVSVVCGCSVVLWFPVGFGVFRDFMFLLSALS